MNSSVGSTDSNLLARALRHDADAWDSLVDLYGPWIYNWTRRLGLSAEDGADATQDALLAVYCSLEQFRMSEPSSTFRGWLWTVLRSKVLDQQRRRSGAPCAMDGAALDARGVSVPDHLPDESTSSAAANERTGLLARGLEQVRGEFEARTWQAFWMVVVDGRSPGEVAAQLGMTPMAVRQAKSRVLRRLRDQLGEGGPASS